MMLSLPSLTQFAGAALGLVVGALASLLPVPLSLGLLALALLAVCMWLTPLASLVALLVLAPLRVLILTESSFQLPLDIGQILFAVLLAVRVLHLVSERQPFVIRLAAVHTPLLILIGVSMFTVFVTNALTVTLTEVIKWLSMLIVAHYISLEAHAGKWRWIVAALILAGVANALVGIYIFFGGSGALHLLVLERYFRAFGTFGQPNPFGGFLAILFPLAFCMLLDAIYRLWSARSVLWLVLTGFYACAVLLLAAGVFVSWSRGAWLSLIAAMVGVVFALPRRTFISFAVSLIAVGLFVGAYTFNLIPQSVVARLASSTSDFFAFQDMRGIDITTDNYAVAERLAHWQAALNMAEANPLGVGLGNYEVVYDQYRLLAWKFPLGHAHNYYLNILAEAGIIGLLAYLFFMGHNLVMCWYARALPAVGIRLLATGLWGAWLYLVFHSFLDNLYVNNLFLHIGAILGLSYFVYHSAYGAKRVE
jgi:O-antigen ligase